MTLAHPEPDIIEPNLDGWRAVRAYLTAQDIATLDYLETWQGVTTDALLSLALHRAGQNIADDR